MGYYSKVRLLTTQKAWDKLIKAMDKYANKHVEREFARRMFEPEVEWHSDKLVYVAWECIKWWEETHPEQAEFMKTLKSCGEPYRWIRAGEEIGDVEEHYYDDNDELPDLYAEVTFNDEEIELILSKQ